MSMRSEGRAETISGALLALAVALRVISAVRDSPAISLSIAALIFAVAAAAATRVTRLRAVAALIVIAASIDVVTFWRVRSITEDFERRSSIALEEAAQDLRQRIASIEARLDEEAIAAAAEIQRIASPKTAASLFRAISLRPLPQSSGLRVQQGR